MRSLLIVILISFVPTASFSNSNSGAGSSSGLSGIMNAWGVGENLGLMAAFIGSGEAMIAAGMASTPPNAGLIAAGIADLVTAGKHKDSAGSNRETGIDSTYKQGLYNYGKDNYTWDAAKRDFDKILSDAEINVGDNTYTPSELFGTDITAKIPDGYSVDEDGNITTPTGKSYSPDQLGSGADMAKAGLIDSDPTVITMVDEALKKGKRDFKLSGLQRPGVGGGYASGSSKRTTKNKFDFKMPSFGQNKGRSPASGPKTSGLSVNYNGQAVGASTGSLLGGIGQAYKRQRERGQYVKPTK